MSWPPAGGNWEGGTVHRGRRLIHVPHVGWRDNGPAGASPYRPAPNRLVLGRIYRDPLTARRRSRLARWLHQRRAGVVTVTTLVVVLGYAAVVAGFSDRPLPDMRSAAVLVAAGVVLVAVLLSVVLWARDE